MLVDAGRGHHMSTSLFERLSIDVAYSSQPNTCSCAIENLVVDPVLHCSLCTRSVATLATFLVRT